MNNENESNSKIRNDDDDDDGEYDEFDDNNDEFPFIQSKWQDHVEIGLTIAWPPAEPFILELSTQLPQESIAPLFDGTQWAGTRVWKAAMVALEYLVQLEQEEKQEQEKPSNDYKSLLELGCGLGVPGMLWYCWKLANNEKRKKQQQKAINTNNKNNNDDDENEFQAILTDQPDLLSQLQGNIETNFSNNNNNNNISAYPLSWSKEGILELLSLQRTRMEQQQSSSSNSENDNNKKDVASSFSSSSFPLFDICLNCDCIYTPLYGKESWMALCTVLETIAIESPSTLLVTSVERRNGDGVEEFLQRLQATNVVEDIQCVLRNDDDKHHVIEIYVTKGKGNRGGKEGEELNI